MRLLRRQSLSVQERSASGPERRDEKPPARAVEIDPAMAARHSQIALQHPELRIPADHRRKSPQHIPFPLRRRQRNFDLVDRSEVDIREGAGRSHPPMAAETALIFRTRHLRRDGLKTDRADQKPAPVTGSGIRSRQVFSLRIKELRLYRHDKPTPRSTRRKSRTGG